MPVFKTISSDDDILNRVQDNITEAVDKLLADPEAYGNIITQELLIGVDNLVYHKLGRNWIGWNVIDIDAEANIWRINNSIPTLALTLRCSANCTIKLKVF